MFVENKWGNHITMFMDIPKVNSHTISSEIYVAILSWCCNFVIDRFMSMYDFWNESVWEAHMVLWSTFAYVLIYLGYHLRRNTVERNLKEGSKVALLIFGIV